MQIQNLTIQRIIFHEVHKRLDDRRPLPPTYGDHVIQLNQDATDALRDRIVTAAGSQSQSMDMTIARFGADSSVAIAQDLLAAQDGDEFVDVSRRVADRLSDAQQSRGIPGGVLAVFVGRSGLPARPMVGFIKAELHGGFRRAENLTVEYLRSLFMTPQTKLYKIGLFAHDGGGVRSLPAGWAATVYDSNMSATNRDGAARYFFEGFLGLELPKSSARMTRIFWEGTSKFIRAVDVSEERRTDLLTGLYTYLRVDQAPNVEVATFANTYLEPNLRDDYRAFMGNEGFPQNAIAKDLSELAGKLKRRRVRFSRDVQLTGSPEAFSDLVTIETIPAGEMVAEDGGGAPELAGETWTRITIRDRIRDQE